MEDITYNVRAWKTKVYRGKKVTTYYVRWIVDHHERKGPFRNSTQAESFRSSLVTAALNGEAFSGTTGRPVSWQRDQSKDDSELLMSWYAFTMDYATAKWPYALPNHRRGIAEALTDATEVMIADGDCPYSREEIRRALRTWTFSARLRGHKEPPEDIAAVVRWLEAATVPAADLTRPGTGRPSPALC